MKRNCERIQARIPRLVEGSLPPWRQRLLRRHIRRCVDCTRELERQRAVTDGLRQLGTSAVDASGVPPDGLLESILDDVNNPGLRARAAGPARGAVSGARPELSVAALLLTIAAVYLVWRAARKVADVLDPD